MFTFRKVGKFWRLALLVGAFCFVGYALHAQPVPPGSEDTDVPIPGIGILLAAGAAFGAKKAYDIYRRKGR